jgi:hypothetical protein
MKKIFKNYKDFLVKSSDLVPDPVKLFLTRSRPGQKVPDPDKQYNPPPSPADNKKLGLAFFLHERMWQLLVDEI